MAKAIVEKNQAFLDKVIRENKKLILTCAQLKQELSELNTTFSNCKKETMHSLEPKIQKLLEQHKVNMEKQKKELQDQIFNNPYAEENERIQNETEKKLKIIHESCKLSLEEIKKKAIENEKKLKESFNQRISKVPQQIQEESQKLKEKLQSERSSWQESRTEKLRFEFKKKNDEIIKISKEKQESMYNDMMSKLKQDAKNENQELIDQYERNIKDHRKTEKDLTLEIEEKNRKITEIYQMRKERERELSEIREKVNKCQCEKLKAQIESFKIKLSNLNEKLKEEKQKQFLNDNEVEQEKTDLKMKLESIQSNNQMLEFKISDLKTKIQSEKMSSQQKIEELTLKHKNELALVAERVKQTVAKKDEIIQNLMANLNEIGNENDF
ncbi:hypothetical protein M9Y10_016868 [Tritrichomonas musculus]|uniref:Uncharacterized protein n=1 Tax=Tritrichomonas musculus TaxID=1915356 RepID=A0ABR2HYP7_9EUKA